MNRVRRFAAACLVAELAVGPAGNVLLAQEEAESITAISDNEYEIVRPTTCPLHVSGGFAGYFDGVIYEGHEWTAEWNRHQVLDPVTYSLATYQPISWNGYAVDKGNYIVSYDHNARWYGATLEVKCTATWLYFLGRVVSITDHYKIVGHFGMVEECNSGPNAAYVDAAAYDPYSADWGSGGTCSTQTGGGSGGDGGGTQYQPGDQTGGQTVDWDTGIGNGGVSACGEAATVEAVCIEVWNDIEQKWDEFACGYATTC